MLQGGWITTGLHMALRAQRGTGTSVLASYLPMQLVGYYEVQESDSKNVGKRGARRFLLHSQSTYRATTNPKITTGLF